MKWLSTFTLGACFELDPVVMCFSLSMKLIKNFHEISSECIQKEKKICVLYISDECSLIDSHITQYFSLLLSTSCFLLLHPSATSYKIRYIRVVVCGHYNLICILRQMDCRF